MVDFRDSLQNTKQSIQQVQAEINRREIEDARIKAETQQRISEGTLSPLQAKKLTSRSGSDINQLQKELRILQDKQRELESKQSESEQRTATNQAISSGEIVKETTQSTRKGSLTRAAQLSARLQENVRRGVVRLPTTEVRITNLGENNYQTTGVTKSLTLRDEQGKPITTFTSQERAVVTTTPLLAGRRELQAQADEKNNGLNPYRQRLQDEANQRQGLDSFVKGGTVQDVRGIIQRPKAATESLTKDQEILLKVNQGFERQSGQVFQPTKEQAKPRPTISSKSQEGFTYLEQLGNEAAKKDQFGAASALRTTAFIGGTATTIGGFVEKVGQTLEPLGQTGQIRRKELTGVATYAATNPFGFVKGQVEGTRTLGQKASQADVSAASEIAAIAVGDKIAEQSIKLGRQANTKVETKYTKGEFGTIGTKTGASSVDIGKLETGYEVTQKGLFTDKIVRKEIKDIKADFTISSQEKALGTRDIAESFPIRTVRRNELSTAYSPARVFEGEINVGIGKGKGLEPIKVEGIRTKFGEEIVNIGDNTLVSQSMKEPYQFKGQDVYKTRSLDLNSKELTTTITTENKRLIDSRAVADDLYVQGVRKYESERSFLKSDLDNVGSTRRPIDVKATESRFTTPKEYKAFVNKDLVIYKPLSESKAFDTFIDKAIKAQSLEPQFIKPKLNILDGTKSNLKPINIKDISFTLDKTSTKVFREKSYSQGFQREEIISKGQTQVFKEQPKVQEPKFININQQVAKINKEPVKYQEPKSTFKSQEIGLTGLQIPKGTIEKIEFAKIKGTKGLGLLSAIKPVSSISNLNKSSTSSIQNFKNELDKVTFNKPRQEFKSISDIKIDQSFKNDQSLKQDQKLKQEQRLKQEQKLKQEQALKTEQSLGQSFRFTPRIETPTVGIPFFKQSVNSKGQQTGYNVYVNEKGRAVKLNKTPLPINKAKAYLEYTLDNSVAASGELRKGGVTKAKDINYTGSPFKFRERRTPKALKIVERSGFRIDSSGEKQGLRAAKIAKGFFAKGRFTL